MKKIVGIIANTLGFQDLDLFHDKYFVINSYIKKIKETGGIPIIIPPVDLNLNIESLDICDALIITGGTNIHKYHLDVVDYALKNNKKLLGICMGMQAIAMYVNKNSEENVLKSVFNHYNFEGVTKDNPEVLVHDIQILENTQLFQIFKTNKIKVNSLHKYAIKEINKPFKISARSEDIIEAIEYKNIIGVQFHPELMKNTENLFKWLIG